MANSTNVYTWAIENDIYDNIDLKHRVRKEVHKMVRLKKRVNDELIHKNTMKAAGYCIDQSIIYIDLIRDNILGFMNNRKRKMDVRQTFYLLDHVYDAIIRNVYEHYKAECIRLFESEPTESDDDSYSENPYDDTDSDVDLYYIRTLENLFFWRDNFL